MLNIEKPTDISKLRRRRWVNLFLEMIVYNAFVLYMVMAVLLGPLNAKHGWPIEALVMVYTVLMVGAGPIGLIVGKVRDMTGDRTVVLIGAIIYGIGCIIAAFTTNIIVFFIATGLLASFGTNTSIAGFTHNIGVLFPDKQGLATGIFYGGVGFLSMLVIPGAAYFAESFSPTIVLCGLGVFAIIACFILVPIIAIPPANYIPEGWNPEVATAKNKKRVTKGVEVSWKQLLCLPALYLFLLAFTFSDTIAEALYSNYSIIGQELTGMDAMDAAWMGSLISFGTAFGSLFVGALADKFGAARSMAVTSIIVGVVILVGVLLGINVPILAVICTLVGICIGVMMVLMPVVTMEYFGNKDFGLNFGIMRLAVPFASLIGPQLTVRMPHISWITLLAVVSIISALFYFAGVKAMESYKKRQGFM